MGQVDGLQVGGEMGQEGVKNGIVEVRVSDCEEGGGGEEGQQGLDLKG